MKPTIVLLIKIKINSPQNPKEKSKIDAKLKSMKVSAKIKFLLTC